MTTFLLDANLSPKIADHLHGTLGLDVDSLVRRGIQHLSDEEVVVLAKEEKRVIITLDKDFGGELLSSRTRPHGCHCSPTL